MPTTLFFFFFQAEDGIRDLTVTGVQTCALPIFPEQAVKGQLRNDLLRYRRVPVSPGDERAVHAGESASGDIDAGARRVDTPLDRRQRRQGADALRGPPGHPERAGAEGVPPRTVG